MLTVRCKSYTARHDADGILLEVSEPTPADALPRLLKRADAAARLGISERHLDALTKKHRIRPVADLPVRFREGDLLRLTESAKPLGVAPKILPMERKPTLPPAPKITTSEPAAEKPRRRVTLSVD